MCYKPFQLPHFAHTRAANRLNRQGSPPGLGGEGAERILSLDDAGAPGESHLLSLTLSSDPAPCYVLQTFPVAALRAHPSRQQTKSAFPRIGGGGGRTNSSSALTLTLSSAPAPVSPQDWGLGAERIPSSALSPDPDPDPVPCRVTFSPPTASNSQF